MGVETILRASRLTATPAMTDDNQLSFNLPSVSRKKVTAAFDGGRLSSDSGVMLQHWPIAGAELLTRSRRLLPTVAILRTSPIRSRMCCARACWRLAAATRMATTSIDCALTRPSSSPAVDCPIPGRTSARSRPSRAGRTHPRCARLSASPMPWSTSGAGATRSRPGP